MIAPWKSGPKELLEGPEAFKRFDALVGKVLSVPHEVVLERDKEHKATIHLRGKKRGPKPKVADPSPETGIEAEA
ncbi:MAG TPA: hypothetical protein VGG97_19130 [Bryobacteraceae bacterium]|jgi:hypothetical protein